MTRSSSDRPARTRRRLVRLAIVAVVLLVTGVFTLDGLARSTEGTLSSFLAGVTAPEASPGSALAAVDDLAVKGRAPKTGYDRDEFGPAWADVDRNGCDTRNDILARDLTEVTYEEGTHECIVLTGDLADPFTGEAIAFQRGQKTSTAVQIDHVVALSDAWQKGAQALGEDERRELANDPLNLLAVDGPSNGAKGDGDTASWLPPNTSYRCEYVARQVAVKLRYELWVTTAEQAAMTDVLSTCPDETLPTAG
ncbi:HNH endonuclease family protein [Isoptericola sp. G70]|uniref:HNH endonuclease family protein n=1 Tax=Isoptericola sp. G70 TaxID=3376633 RepID=UPI003A80DBE6